MEKVKISKDGATIDFVASDKVPVSLKKFRQSPELEGFYRFIFENDLRKEALQVIDRIFLARKASKLKKPLSEAIADKKRAVAKAAQASVEVAPAVAAPKKTEAKVVAKKAVPTSAPKKTAQVAKKAAAKAPAKPAKKVVAKKAAPAKKTKKK